MTDFEKAGTLTEILGKELYISTRYRFSSEIRSVNGGETMRRRGGESGYKWLGVRLCASSQGADPRVRQRPAWARRSLNRNRKHPAARSVGAATGSGRRIAEPVSLRSTSGPLFTPPWPGATNALPERAARRPTSALLGLRDPRRHRIGSVLLWDHPASACGRPARSADLLLQRSLPTPTPGNRQRHHRTDTRHHARVCWEFRNSKYSHEHP